MIKCASPSCSAVLAVKTADVSAPVVIAAARSLGWRLVLAADGSREYLCDRCAS